MKPVILFFCLLVLIACNSSKPKADITSIELATGSCLNGCQYTAIKIDSLLNCQFYGGWANTKDTDEMLKGYYSGKINKSQWDTLTNHLQEINYQKLKKSLFGIDGKVQQFELIVHYGNEVKHIKAFGLSKKIKRVFDEIVNTYKMVKLIPVKQPIKFETTYQQLDQFKASKSVNESKKLGMFLCGFDVNGQKINGQEVVSIFAEKQHAINDFGVCDTTLTRWQYVIVFKPTTLTDTIFNKLYFKNWVLTTGSDDRVYPFDPKDEYVFSAPGPLFGDPDDLLLTCTTQITKQQKYSYFSGEVRNHTVPPPIKTELTFYRTNGVGRFFKKK